MSPCQDCFFVVPDQHIDRATEALVAANFPRCCQDDCRIFQGPYAVPRPYAHFGLDSSLPPEYQRPGLHHSRVNLHKKSQMCWALPDIPLGTPALDDPTYMLVTDDRLDEYEPGFNLGREAYTHYPIKMITLPRYVESVAYGYLRWESTDDDSYWLNAICNFDRRCNLQTADLEPRIRRLWRLLDHPRSGQPFFRYCSRLAAELRSANFFPQEEEEKEEE